jgi:arylsulfatase A-like enzyme
LLTDPYMYNYYNSSYVHYNGSHWENQGRISGYSTDQIAEYVASWISDAVEKKAPFFAVAAPVAPHMSKGQTYANNNTKLPSFAKPKDEYVHLFPDLKIPRTANFNPTNRSGVNQIWDMEQLDEGNVWALDEQYRYRQRALRSVDDMIDTLIQKLEDTGVLNNTVIIYTSDNGYHIGNHRLQGGKLQCFEEDVNIPLVIRGPQVGSNQTCDLVTGHIDIAPTILHLAGVDVDPAWKLDGTAITFPLENEADYLRNMESRGETTHIEFWGPMKQEGMFGGVKDKSVFHEYLQIYKSLRIHGNGYNLMYSVWCKNDAHELYDMTWDQQQMTNLHPDAPVEDFFNNAYHRGMNTLLGRPIWQLIYRLDALVLIQKSCSADTCREPWKQLHPEGNVNTLADALNERYDAFYENSYKVAKVGWEVCFNGLQAGNSSTLYSLANEQPLWQNLRVRNAVLQGAASSVSVSQHKQVALALALLASLTIYML